MWHIILFLFWGLFSRFFLLLANNMYYSTMPKKWITSRYFFWIFRLSFHTQISWHRHFKAETQGPIHENIHLKTKNPSGTRKPAQEDERNHLKDFEQTITNFCDGWPSMVWSLYKLMFGGPRPTSSHLLGHITIRPPGALPSMWWGEEVVYERCWFFIADSAKNTDKKLHNVHYIILI